MSWQFLTSENHPKFLNYFERNCVEWNAHDIQETIICLNLNINFVFETQSTIYNTLLCFYLCCWFRPLSGDNSTLNWQNHFAIFRKTYCESTISQFLEHHSTIDNVTKCMPNASTNSLWNNWENLSWVNMTYFSA